MRTEPKKSLRKAGQRSGSKLYWDLYWDCVRKFQYSDTLRLYR